MIIKELKIRPDINENNKLSKAYIQFQKLIMELNNKKLTDEIVNFINDKIDELNLIQDLGKELRTKIKKHQTKTISLIEKEMKIVAINHYRNTWLAIGMTVFGIPLGIAFSASLGNMAFIAIGIPIGMALGIAVGTKMDNKAKEEGRQLDLEIKF